MLRFRSVALKWGGGGVILIFLLICIAIEEYYGHAFENFLVRRGYLEKRIEHKPDYWCIRGWTNTLEKLDVDCDIVFFGNSITCGSDFQHYFPDKRIVNLGYPGDKVSGMIDRVEMIRVCHPEKIFVMAGINDISNVTVDAFIQQYSKLILQTKKTIPNAQIYVQSILPVNHVMNKDYKVPNTTIKVINAKLDSLSHAQGCIYIDLYPYYEEDGEMKSRLTKDGIHLLTEAYGVWAKAIDAYVYE